MFYLGGIGLAIFLNLLLLSKRKKSTADKILAAWLLLITIHLLFYFAKMALYPQLLGIDMPLPLIQWTVPLLIYIGTYQSCRITESFITSFYTGSCRNRLCHAFPDAAS